MPKQAPIASIFLSRTKLPRAERFGSLLPELRNFLNANGIYADHDAPIVKGRNKNEWRLLIEDKEGIDAYKLKLSFDREQDEELVELYTDTMSGLPESVWDFKAFTSDMYSAKTNRKLYYNCDFRNSLDEKQKQKWDFFFRPDKNKILKQYDEIIEDCEIDLTEAIEARNSTRRSLMIGGGVLFFFLITTQIGPWKLFFIALFVALAYIPYLFFKLINGSISLNMSKHNDEINNLEDYLKEYNYEKSHILNQLKERKIASKEEIFDWYKEELESLTNISKERFILSEGTKEPQVLRSFAIYQPEFKDLANSFPRATNTFYGFRPTSNGLLYSGQMLIFIHQAKDKICISKFFYDFVLGKKYREENLEYHYSDLVGIAINSKVVHNPFYNENTEHKEVNAIWMSFTDSKTLEFSLIDDDTSQDITKRLSKQVKSNEITDLDFLELDSPAEESDDESMKLAAQIVRDIQNKKAELLR